MPKKNRTGTFGLVKTLKVKTVVLFNFLECVAGLLCYDTFSPSSGTFQWTFQLGQRNVGTTLIPRTFQNSAESVQFLDLGFQLVVTRNDKTSRYETNRKQCFGSFLSLLLQLPCFEQYHGMLIFTNFK